MNTREPFSEPAAYRPGSTALWNNSWREFYDRFHPAILAYARQSGLNDHSAEDVLQEVMTTVIRGWQEPQPGSELPPGSFRAWLWGVIRNRVRSVRRKDRKEEAASPLRTIGEEGETRMQLKELPQPAPDFEQAEEARWKRALLAAALSKLQTRVTPENFAIYTELLEEKATPEELGRRYGKMPNAVYAAKHRCEKLLLTELRSLRLAWEHLDQRQE